MNAVMEQEPEVAEEPVFVMPRPKIGMQVLWYPAGLKTGRDPYVVLVLQVGQKGISIKELNGLRTDSVRHIDDPKLRLNEDQRSGGAWDFTDDHKDQATVRAAHAIAIADLTRRLIALETAKSAAAVAAVVAQARKPTPPKAE